MELNNGLDYLQIEVSMRTKNIPYADPTPVA
jgi:hypothetical protein